MQEQYEIQAVQNNQERQQSFDLVLTQYSRARKAGCYFECLWILYSLLEDRTSGLFYLLGFTQKNNKNSVIETKKIKACVREMIMLNPSEKRYGFNSFNGKLKNLIALLSWTSTVSGLKSDYQKEVFSALQKFSQDEEINNTIQYLKNEWREKRNQLTHALMNKNQYAVSAELVCLVEKGYSAFRVLDKICKYVAKKEIRSKFNIQ